MCLLNFSNLKRGNVYRGFAIGFSCSKPIDILVIQIVKRLTTNLSVGFSLKRSVQLLENILTNGRYNFYASLKIYKYISRKIFHVQHNIL